MAEVQDIRVTVAPFYDTTARKFAAMSESERIAIRENFFHNAAFLAELCGLSFNPDIESQNVGGFENEHGKKLIEVSHTFSFPESNKDKVNLFAALMAEFGYQAQESTISACYCDRTGLSNIVSAEKQTREQHQGIPEVGIQQQGTGVGSARYSISQGSRNSSEHSSRRLGLLCRVIGEAHRRLEEYDRTGKIQKDAGSFLSKPR